MLPTLATSLLGLEDGAGFGWQNMTTYKTGVQYRAGGGWTWRGGYSFGSPRD
jgi:long-chain fatty acid transport protein